MTTTKSSYNSIRYHCRAIASILSGRTERVMYKYKLAIATFFMGAGVVLLAVIVPNIPVTTSNDASPSYPTPVDTTYVTASNQTDTVETELSTNTDWNFTFKQNAQDIQFNFTGIPIGQNISIAKFQCNIDDSFWFDCKSPMTPKHQPVGEHTFEVRAVDSNDNPDHSPVAWVWRVAE